MDNLAVREPAGKAGPVGVRAVGPFAHATDLIVAAIADPPVRRSRLACQVLCILAHHAASSGRCWRSKRSLADQLATDPSAIRRAIRLLEAHGWLRREPRQGRATVYHLPIERGRPGPAEGAPRPATEGAGAPRTSQSQPEREPGHRYAGNPLEPKTDAELLEAVATAAKSRDPAAVNRAAHDLAKALDNDFQWVGGFRKALYASSPAEAVSRLERAFRAGHGSAFFREPPGPPPPRTAPAPIRPAVTRSSPAEPEQLSCAEVWARFRRQGPPRPRV